MNTSDYDRCSPFLRFTNDPVAWPAISGVDANPYDVAGANLLRIEARDGFINYQRVADQFGWCRACDHKKPPRRDDAIANSSVCRIYENDFVHALSPESFIGSKVIRIAKHYTLKFPDRLRIVANR